MNSSRAFSVRLRRPISTTLVALCCIAPALAESVSTRYGNVAATQATNGIEISFENSTITSLDAESVSLLRIAPKGQDEYVLMQQWLPGLHCHYAFMLLTIYPNKTTQLSPTFGNCMELKSVQALKNGVKVTLSTPQIGQTMPRYTSFWWRDRTLSKVR